MIEGILVFLIVGAGVIITVFVIAWLLVAGFEGAFGLPVVLQYQLWKYKLVESRHVEIDEFESNYCRDCGRRLHVKFDTTYDDVTGKLKKAEATLFCRRGFGCGQRVTVDVSPHALKRAKRKAQSDRTVRDISEVYPVLRLEDYTETEIAPPTPDASKRSAC